MTILLVEDAAMPAAAIRERTRQEGLILSVLHGLRAT